MLEGAGFVAQLITSYGVIEQTYARVDSELSAALRKSLLAFYMVIFNFQIPAIKYFDGSHKFLRALKGLNPVSAADLRQRREAIDTAKQRVDQDIALVHSDVTKRGIDELVAGKDKLLASQEEQFAATRDGILALARNTGSSFKSQQSFIGEQFAEADARQQKRNDAIVEMWREPLDVLSTRLEEERVEKEIQEVRSIRNWLSSAEPEMNDDDARRKRPLQLGNWLIKHPKFQKWEGSVSSILWVDGFAGTGKTGLACRVIDHLREKLQDEASDRLAFFYCSNDKAGGGREESSSRNDPVEALRSIVSQLSTSQQHRRVAPIVQEKYAAIGPRSDRNRPLNYSDCVEILVAISKDTQINIVIDALDELDRAGSPDLIKNLKDVIRRSPGNVKVYISTRSFPAIENDLNSGESIEVTAENNSQDVRSFVKQTLQARIDEKALLNGDVPENLKAEIEEVLTKRARNMFLYASLLLNQLCDRNRTDDEDSIRKKLQTLPSNLGEMYNRIMVEIHDDRNNSQRSCQVAQSTFKLLLCSQEPLQYESFLEAVSPPERKADIDEVLHACRTLVIKEKSVFEFAHYTVREYVSKMKQYSPSQCNIVGLRSCLTILNKSFADGQRDTLSESQKSFNEYALRYWPLHYEGIERDDLDEHRVVINAMLRTFLLRGRSKTDQYALWFAEAQEKVKQLGDNNYLASKLKNLQASPPTPLFAACVFGLEDIIARFGREVNSLNSYNAHGQSALCLAIENNNFDVVKAMLSRRFAPDLNLLNVRAVQQFEDFDASWTPDIIIFASPLQCAAASGNLDIVEFLIEGKAHIDLVAGYYGSPLQAAALRGHQAVVSLLLSKGAEPNSQGGFHGNALQAAAAGGHSEIISLLLDNQPAANVSTPGGHFGSALMAAVCSGSSDTVWALLDEKADPNMMSKVYGSPLENAASQAQKEIVSLLLDCGAKADTSPKGNAVHILHKAALYNMTDLAEYCFGNHCKIDMVTTEGPWYPRRYGDFVREMTPLAFACAEGHVGMVDFLLDHGAPFEQNNPNSANLWIAAYQGHAEVVDTLIKRFKAGHSSEETAKFFLQRPPKSGHPLLFAAASSGNPDVVRTLLDYGVKYESNWFGATPLLATASFRGPDVTRVLLNYSEQGKVDVRINQRAGHGRTAFFEACANNQQEIAKMLLEAGCDYAIGDNDNATALHVSTHNGNFDLVALIVKKASADPDRLHKFLDTRHSSGRTALIDCAEGNRLSCLNLLLEYGADYTIPGNAGNTPLMWASRAGFDEVVDALLRKAKDNSTNKPRHFQDFINHRNGLGETALFFAARDNRLSTVQLLLEYESDYLIPNNSRVTALHASSFGGLEDMVSKLLEKISAKVDRQHLKDFLDSRNYVGKTALMDASDTGRPNIVVKLLNYGADYFQKDNNNFTALHYSAFRNRGWCVRRLLESASQDKTENGQKFKRFLNQQGSNNRATAIRDAAIRGWTHIVENLLEYDADYTLMDNGKRNPFHHAVGSQNPDMFVILLKHASKSDDRARLKEALNAKDEGGESVWAGLERRENQPFGHALKERGVHLNSIEALMLSFTEAS